MNLEPKNFFVATTKGVVGAIPLAGSLLSEYIGLAQDNITNKRTQEWREKVEGKLQELEVSIQELSKDEFFYNSYQEAMFGFLKSYEEEKRDMFINSLMNCTGETLPNDKKIMFIQLLDSHTLNEIRLLKYYSISHFNREEQEKTRYFEKEKRYEKALLDNEMFENDKDYLLLATNRLANNGLLFQNMLQWGISVQLSAARSKKTSSLGDEFLKFIENGAK